MWHASRQQLAPGTILRTTTDPSPYWRSTFDAGAITDENQHHINTFVSPQNQGFAARAYHFRSQAFKELAFELHRRENFPDVPSRKHCLFLTNAPADWQSALTSGGTQRFLHEVRVLEGARILQTDASLLGNNNLHYDEFLRLADQYWRSSTRTGLWEHLLEGEVEILSEVPWPEPEPAMTTTAPGPVAGVAGALEGQR